MPNSEPPFSFANFKEIAGRFLSKKDAEILDKLTIEPARDRRAKTGSVFLDNWYNFERSLRIALEQIRYGNTSFENSISYDEKELLNTVGFAVQIAKIACGMENPLEAEKFLDEQRFLAADTIRDVKTFHSDAVFSYGIKLLLRLRAYTFNVDAGRREYSTVYDAILQSTVG